MAVLAIFVRAEEVLLQGICRLEQLRKAGPAGRILLLLLLNLLGPLGMGRLASSFSKELNRLMFCDTARVIFL